MFGKWMGKTAASLLVVVIALLFGARLLAFLAIIVLNARTGNLAPITGLVLLTFGIVIIDSRIEYDSRLTAILTVGAWFVSVYSAIAIGFTVLVYGSIASVFSAGLFLASCMILRNPVHHKRKVNSFLGKMRTSLQHVSKPDVELDGASAGVWQVFLVPHTYYQMLLTLMEERPLLPICLVRFEETDAIFVNCNENVDWPSRIRKLATEYGLDQLIELSVELSQYIGSLSYFESFSGIAPKNFRIARKPEVVARILDNPPVRTTVLPSTTGPKVLVCENEALGMDLDFLPSGTEEAVVFEKDASIITQSVKADGKTTE